MFCSEPSHQAAKSLGDFLAKLPGVLRPGLEPLQQPPAVGQTLRLGVAGHLHLTNAAALSPVLEQVLAALRNYVATTSATLHERLSGDGEQAPAATLRLISQLASGLDQLAAGIGAGLGYELNVVLPGPRAEVESEMSRNRVGGDADPIPNFRDLAAKAKRVLELDRAGANPSAPFADDDFEQAALIMLSYSDIVLVAVHDHAGAAAGGTRWIEQQAEARDLPLIRIPTGRPEAAALCWTEGGRRLQAALFDPNVPEIDPRIFAGALDEPLIGRPQLRKATRLRGFGERFVRQFQERFNERIWDARWDSTGVSPLTGSVSSQIDGDYKRAKVWADTRASGLAALVRGAFIVSAIAGIFAICGALIGLLYPGAGIAGKLLELGSLLIIFYLINRSNRQNWRSDWLSIRHLERSLDQAAWMQLAGRGYPIQARSFVSNFESSAIAAWCDIYFRAVVRASAIPGVSMSDNYRIAAHHLVLSNLVQSQIDYYAGEIPFQLESERRLKCWIDVCVMTAFFATFVYVIIWLATLCPAFIDLLARWIPDPQVTIHAWLHRVAEPCAAAIGILAPAIIAALSAIRSQGEYAQMAARYEDSKAALGQVCEFLQARRPDNRREGGTVVMHSATLASQIAAATDILKREVVNWRAVLDKKSIEA